MPAGGRRGSASPRRNRRPDEPGRAVSATAASEARGQVLSLRVEGLSDEGRGVARHAGKTLFVRDALPGEQVRAVIRRTHARYDEADLLAVQVPAAQRIEPRCDHYWQCGGCALQHLDYGGQLAHKQAVLDRLLSPWRETLQWAPALSAEPWQYRYRARLLLADGGAGFRARNSHERVAVRQCPVLAPALAACLPSLQACLARWPAVRGELLLAWAGQDLVAVQLNLQRGSRRAIQALREWADDAGMVWVGSGGESGATVSEPPLQMNVAGQQLRFGPADFIQSNQLLNPALVGQALDWLAVAKGEAVADWFCGLGNFSLPLAAHGARVTGFDLDQGLLERAAGNARMNRLDIDFRRADLLSGPIPGIAGFDAALLDPPRAGAAELCRQLAACKSANPGRPRRLVYVSCDPQTLARDIALLAAGGWRPQRAGIADMFPQTRHVEAMVLLT